MGAVPQRAGRGEDEGAGVDLDHGPAPHLTRRLVALLEQAHALLAALMEILEEADDERVPLVCLPLEGASLASIERVAILTALKRTRGEQRAAARLLGITPRVMNYKLQTHGILRPIDRKRGA